jgi:DtxR family transcriptional regulator, Mn-dependent transcriptional regulator
MLTISELRAGHPAAPEYLVNIFIIQRDYGYANNARLAKWMDVSRSAVSQATARLKALSLIVQDEYGGVRLSPEGRRLAVSVLTRHYLIEHLLVRVLNYPWDKADEEASKIQETISDGFAEYLHKYLGEPQTCPHGNPFPDTPLEKNLVEAQKLSELEEDKTARVLRITEEGENVAGMLTACYEHHISPGAEFVILKSGEDALKLRRADGKETFSLPAKYARHIRAESVSV